MIPGPFRVTKIMKVFYLESLELYSISACGIDKKWWEIQLRRYALWRGYSLIGYSYVANCKPAVLGLLEILCFELLRFF